MKKNDQLVLEVFNLQEIGYKLANTQSELTTVQKLFILYGYGVWQKMGEDESNSNATPSEQDEYKRKTMAEIERRRREMEK